MSLELKGQYDKIYKYCYFKVKNTDLAEDLTQETFLKYFTQASFINRGKSLAYLYTIAGNLCIDYYRKRKMEPIDEEISAPDNFLELENNLSVRKAVSKLSSDKQEIILLRFANDLGMGEIASITKLSRFAVHRKIGKALAELKKYLREEDFCE